MTKDQLFHNSTVISLPHRLDRRSSITKQFDKESIPYVFFDAVNGHELEYYGPLKKGEEGVRQSHLALFSKAIDENYKSLFIFEDDVELSENFSIDLETALTSLPDKCDLLYLGASHHVEPKKIKNNIYRISHSYTAHAMYINCHLFSDLMRCITNNPHLPVDVIYALVQPQVHAYAIYPHLAWQSNSYSDIQNKIVDYNFLKEEFVRFRS